EAGFSSFGADNHIYSSGAINESTPGTADAYVVRLDMQGNPDWSYTYNGSGNGDDFLFGGIQGTGMNLFLFGQTTVANNDILVVSLDTTGSERWTYSYNGTGNQEDFPGYVMAQDAHGNIYVPVNSQNANGDIDLCILSLTSTGTFRFLYRYDGPGNGIDLCYAVVAGPDGNMYATGSSTGVGTGEDFTVVSIDTMGNQRWMYRKDGAAHATDESYFSVAFDQNGHLYTSGDLQMASNQSAAVISLQMSSGAERWVHTYSGSGNQDNIAHQVILGPDNKLYAAGVANSSQTNYDVLIMQLDTAGNENWVYTYNGPDSTKDEAMVLNYGYDGNIYFSGIANDNGSMRDWLVGCLSNSGNEKWVNLYSGTGNDQDEGRPVFQLPDGQIISSGFTTNSNGRDFTVLSMCNHPTADFTVSNDTICAGTQITLANNSSDAFNYRWLDNGNFFDYHQNTTFSSLAPGTHDLQLVARSGGCTDTTSINIYIDSLPNVSLALPFPTACTTWNPIALSGGTPAGGMYSGNAVNGGMFDPASLTPGNTDIFYTITTTAGCSSTDTASVYVDACLGTAEQNRNDAINIHPNPFHDMTTVLLNDEETETEFLLFDVTGNVVRTMIIPAHTTSFIIDREDLAPGIYFYNFFLQGAAFAKGKIVVE
ncbi:MAG TPA: T9SS type A sorting domain-containing protein, partial [Bacteroidia bacterium]|nr:T9SS type A sorting domain-containing protein [Bacteroidia bacterium]